MGAIEVVQSRVAQVRAKLHLNSHLRLLSVYRFYWYFFPISIDTACYQCTSKKKKDVLATLTIQWYLRPIVSLKYLNRHLRCTKFRMTTVGDVKSWILKGNNFTSFYRFNWCLLQHPLTPLCSKLHSLFVEGAHLWVSGDNVWLWSQPTCLH